MASTVDDERVKSAKRAGARWWVHLGLIGSVSVSLIFEFVLTLHIALGLVFAVLVGAHLLQRRRTVANLTRRVGRFATLQSRAGRLALSDALLGVLSAGMLVSGVVDLALGHPTRIRWHALTGVALAAYLLVHTLRRRRRLRASTIA